MTIIKFTFVKKCYIMKRTTYNGGLRMSNSVENYLEHKVIKTLTEETEWKYCSDLKNEADLWNNLRQKIAQNNRMAIGNNPITDSEFELIKNELLSKTSNTFDTFVWLKGEDEVSSITIDREDASLGSVSLELYSNMSIGRKRYRYEIAKLDETSLTLLINGVPIVHILLNQTNVSETFQQIKDAKENGQFTNNIFSTIQLFVLTNEQGTYYFANTVLEEMHESLIYQWFVKENSELFEQEKKFIQTYNLHRFITNYLFVSEELKNKSLIALQPHQIHSIEGLLGASKRRQSGYVWFAPGTGKTLTSFMATKLLANQPEVDRTIMLVDNTEISNQRFQAYIAGSNNVIIGDGNGKELSEMILAKPEPNTITIMTPQKLDAALYFIKKEDMKNGTERLKVFLDQYIVLVVDDCHETICVDETIEIKKIFTNTTWFGFTGTPIFDMNKSQTRGVVAKTTEEQYGKLLHSYTFNEAIKDNTLVDFQVEYQNTIREESVVKCISEQMKLDFIYKSLSDSELSEVISQMDYFEKEIYVEEALYEEDEHIQTVARQILNPDNAVAKFGFKNGYPQKTAILTTSSVAMAKRYYHAIKELAKNAENDDRIKDPDFPRLVVTFSLKENRLDTKEIREEMREMVKDYNEYYGTEWSLERVGLYNNDVATRLARKKAEFGEFGNHIDLVIVVDQLLANLDSPHVQTLFVDRVLSYASLIQAFSRTTRFHKDKSIGYIETFRKPFIMEQNVYVAKNMYLEEME